MAPNLVLQISNKIEKSKLSTETKEILTLLMTFFSNMSKSKDNEVSVLQERVIKLEEKVGKLESNLDEASQYERKDTLVLSGASVPVAVQGENCKTIIRNLFREHLQLNLNETDVSTAHRIGRKQPGSVDKRNIIMKLCRRDLVRDIYAACKNMKPPFFINDSLTPLRSKISFVLRQLKKKFPAKVKGCRSYDGKPRVFIAAEGPQTRSRNSTEASPQQSFFITTKLELETFIHDHLKTTLSELTLNW